MTLSRQSLNEDQQVLLNTKSSVEKALHDIESIKSQLEEVAREDVGDHYEVLSFLTFLNSETPSKFGDGEVTSCT